MQTNETAEITNRFNQAFRDHEPAIFKDLIGHLHDRRASMAIGILDPALLGKGLGSGAILPLCNMLLPTCTFIALESGCLPTINALSEPTKNAASSLKAGNERPLS